MAKRKQLCESIIASHLQHHQTSSTASNAHDTQTGVDLIKSKLDSLEAQCNQEMKRELSSWNGASFSSEKRQHYKSFIQYFSPWKNAFDQYKLKILHQRFYWPLIEFMREALHALFVAKMAVPNSRARHLIQAGIHVIFAEEKVWFLRDILDKVQGVTSGTLIRKHIVDHLSGSRSLANSARSSQLQSQQELNFEPQATENGNSRPEFSNNNKAEEAKHVETQPAMPPIIPPQRRQAVSSLPTASETTPLFDQRNLNIVNTSWSPNTNAESNSNGIGDNRNRNKRANNAFSDDWVHEEPMLMMMPGAIGMTYGSNRQVDMVNMMNSNSNSNSMSNSNGCNTRNSVQYSNHSNFNASTLSDHCNDYVYRHAVNGQSDFCCNDGGRHCNECASHCGAVHSNAAYSFGYNAYHAQSWRSRAHQSRYSPY